MPAWRAATALPAEPLARVGGTIVFDPVDGYAVLFGGEGSLGPFGDTWIFKNSLWQEIFPPVSPPARDHYAAAWDAAGPYIVLFGGAAQGKVFGDTWTFLHGNWTNVSATDGPVARWGATMAWNGAMNAPILFGGCIQGHAVNDTWEFADAAWVQLHTSRAPSAREDSVFVWDPTDEGDVLFGGDDYNDTFYQDTWTLDLGGWTRVSANAPQGNLTYSSAAFYPALRGVLLFGGYNGNPTAGTWEFSAGTWSELLLRQAPPARELSQLGADSNDSGLVLFSGEGQVLLSDTWELYGLNVTPALAVNSTNPLQVSFTALASGGDDELTYAWLLGDGSTSNLPSFIHVFSSPGTYLVQITVRDSQGALTIVTSPIVIGGRMVNPGGCNFDCPAILDSGLVALSAAISAVSMWLLLRRRRTDPP